MQLITVFRPAPRSCHFLLCRRYSSPRSDMFHPATRGSRTLSELAMVNTDADGDVTAESRLEKTSFAEMLEP